MFKSLAPILSITFSIIIVLFFARPLFEEAQKTAEAETAYRQTIEDYRSFIAELESLEAMQANVAVSQEERLNTLLPETLDIPQILVNLESLANNNRLLFGNLNTADGETSSRSTRVNAVASNAPSSIEGLDSVSVSFEVIGTYDQFKQFLSELEESLTLAEVTEISLRGANDVFQQYALTVEVYALPPHNQ